MMRNVLKIEIKKALCSRLFVITLIVATTITLVNAIQAIIRYHETLQMDKVSQQMSSILANPDLSMITLFNHWIGGDYVTVTSTLYFLLLPILAALPYGQSYYSERKTGYIKNIVSRTKKQYYHYAKFVAVFISGGIVIVVPLAINFLIVALYVPATTPDLFYDMYYMVIFPHMWANLLYTHPYVYVLLYLLLDFVFAGIISTLSLMCSYIVKNRFLVILIPFFILLGIHYGEDPIITQYALSIEFSPINFLKSPNLAEVMWWVVLIEGALFLFLPLTVMFLWERKRDVY